MTPHQSASPAATKIAVRGLKKSFGRKAVLDAFG